MLAIENVLADVIISSPLVWKYSSSYKTRGNTCLKHIKNLYFNSLMLTFASGRGIAYATHCVELVDQIQLAAKKTSRNSNVG